MGLVSQRLSTVISLSYSLRRGSMSFKANRELNLWSVVNT